MKRALVEHTTVSEQQTLACWVATQVSPKSWKLVSAMFAAPPTASPFTATIEGLLKSQKARVIGASTGQSLMITVSAAAAQHPAISSSSSK